MFWVMSKDKAAKFYPLKSKVKRAVVFLPCAGCKKLCSFCDQRIITNRTFPELGTIEQDLKEQLFGILKWLERKIEKITSKFDCEIQNSLAVEIAFFGGTFTSLDIEYRYKLLSLARDLGSEFKRLIPEKFSSIVKWRGIRFSTKPGTVNRLEFEDWKKFGVFAVELGVQTTEDEVLVLHGRDYTLENVIKDSSALREAGFRVGWQFLVGLPGQKRGFWRKAFSKFIPDEVRIYPLVVIMGTLLDRWIENGELEKKGIKLWNFEDILEEATDLYEECLKRKVEVLKVGLHYEKSLAERAREWYNWGDLVRLNYLKRRFERNEELTPQEKKILSTAYGGAFLKSGSGLKDWLLRRSSK